MKHRLKGRCDEHDAIPWLGRPIPQVLRRGTVMPKGHRDWFAKLEGATFTLAIADVRVADQPLFWTDRGALAQGSRESLTRQAESLRHGYFLLSGASGWLTTAFSTGGTVRKKA